MEPEAIRSVRRGRKRRRDEVQNVSPAEGPEAKKPDITTRSKVLVGHYVKKEFEGSGTFLGKIVYYESGLYRVDYEDGDCEDLESGEVRELLVRDDVFKGGLLTRKKKLDELVSKKSHGLKSANAVVDKVVEVVCSLTEMSCDNDGSTIENECGQVDSDADSSSDSCEHVTDRESGLEAETLLVPPPQLPPSSGTIGVPEECVSHLFSVYSFLRSFSIILFLNPFSLDDFVGSLNCGIPNTLLDAIHVALMRGLKHHLETLSSDGSEQASKCLRCIDWSLLDLLTWPVYLVHYLIVMGHTKRPEWKGFYTDLLDKEYYTLSAGKKLMILQILCDDVLDFAELRAEIDTREESEVGLDSDVTITSPFESGPRRVHPKYSKTSACKDRGVMEIIADSHEIKALCNLNSSASKGGTDAGEVDMDANSDECRVCGMDGTLLCCDGCPSAYHSRCIGVSKICIPEGSWFCPECKISRIGPPITVGTSLRGAELFGTDSYGQLFLGACSHLLVLKASDGTELCLRYYNQNDIPKVLQALHSSVDHTALYSGLCKAILQFWKIPENILALPESVENSINVSVEKIDAVGPILSPYPSGMESHNDLQRAEDGNLDSSITVSNAENVASTCIKTLDLKTQNELPCMWRSGDTATKKVCPLMSSEQIKIEPSVSTASISQQADPSDFTYPRLADRSSVIDLPTSISINSNSSNNRLAKGMRLPTNVTSQSREDYCGAGGRGDRNSSDEWLYMGSSFKSHSYFNHYGHGEFAASAAANLAILSSEENRVSEALASGNPRKTLSANTLLQVKAFSSTAIRFFWPNSEKKLAEVPRERCGWCLSCRAPAASKKACLLNAAALNAIRSAMKILAGLRPIKNGEGSLPRIATYILYLEESLRGLTIGPFLSKSYRIHWQKQVEQASTFDELKSPLLDLEDNIRTIALSPDWVKLVDNWPVESSVAQNVSSSVGQIQKRGPSGRRSRKQPAVCEGIDDSSVDPSSDFIWWRGGKLSMFILQKATLPRSMVRKSARLGGKRKITGVDYAEGSETPRRSRQFIWRAAVEMSNNASQLALQVRYLDLHVKWSDLRRPEQNLQEGKGPETEASAFRNALICDKKVVENKITYGVAFGNQKHLPSRVMKNIIAVEQDQDGKDKLWFFETRIPLYLIKEYEVNAEEVILPSAKKALNSLSKLQRRQLKACRGDAFSYLVRKRDKWDKCSCASCQLDVIVGNAVKCSTCQGYCHQNCTMSSTVYAYGEVEFLITCKQCYDVKTLRQNETSNDSPTSPLPLQVREYQQAVTISAGAKQKSRNRPSSSLVTLESGSDMNHAAPDSSLARKNRHKLCSWGLIWRKKRSEDKEIEDSGIDFQLNHILLKGAKIPDPLKPFCQLCQKPYNSDLVYIQCGTCNNWYHGDAVELEESKISELLGFKCCKCRRIRSPVCPYMDPKSKKQEIRKNRMMDLKQGSAELDSVSGTMRKKPLGQEPMTSILPRKQEVFMPEDDPHLFSLSRAEKILDQNAEVDSECGNTSGMGLQKLPVRRHVKREGDVENFSGNTSSQVELPIPLETNHLMSPTVGASCPLIEWDVSTDGFGDGLVFDYEGLDYEDMEFEPQTYFSFTELLASDDGEMDGDDASVDVLGNLESLSSFTHGEFPEPSGMSYNKDEHDSEFSVQPAVNVVCRMCSHSEPPLDLFCQTCGLLIHSHCSPWGESSFGEDNWKCGSCREWQ